MHRPTTLPSVSLIEKNRLHTLAVHLVGKAHPGQIILRYHRPVAGWEEFVARRRFQVHQSARTGDGESEDDQSQNSRSRADPPPRAPIPSGTFACQSYSAPAYSPWTLTGQTPRETPTEHFSIVVAETLHHPHTPLHRTQIAQLCPLRGP